MEIFNFSSVPDSKRHWHWKTLTVMTENIRNTVEHRSHWMRLFICFNVFSALCLQMRYFFIFCWCPSRWALAWRLHTYLYKFGEKVSPHVFHKKNCCDLNLGDSLCIAIFFLSSDSGNYLLNGFHFFILIHFKWRVTENEQLLWYVSKFSAPNIAFLAFWLAKKLRLWANIRSFTSYGK